MSDPLPPREISARAADDVRPGSFSTESSPPEVVSEAPVEPTRPYRPFGTGQYEPVWVPLASRPVRNRVWLHALLFAATILTTTYVGIFHWISYMSDYREVVRVAIPFSVLLTKGLWYSASILTILGAHELGHYFACRYYRVDASLPYFLPVPIVDTGTFGAFIRIRQPSTRKRTVFDIGIAGPLAGFVFLVPALFVGIHLSHVALIPPHFNGFELGEPLLFKLATWLTWGEIPDGYSLNLHPMAFAAWFGLLATALNLLPIGQLDGGHISYAVFKRHSTTVTYLGVVGLIVLNAVLAFLYGTPALLFFTVLIVVMLKVFGPRHPPVLDEDAPLGLARLVLAGVALVVFVLCFTPVPIRGI